MVPPLLFNQILIFYNQSLVEKTTKSKIKMWLKRNGGTMKVSHKAKVNGYRNSMCFSKKYITNIIVLSNLRLK